MKYDKSFLRRKLLLLRKKKYLTAKKFNYNLIFRLIKKHFHKKKIIIGGYYPSNYEVNILKFLEESEKKFNYEFGHIIDLDITAPLRNVEDIRQAYKIFLKDGFDNLITGTRSRKNPYFNMIEITNGKVELSKQLKDIPVNRQQSPQVYDMNASIYIWTRDCLLKENSLFSGSLGFYEMPEDRSIDIDSPLEWEIVKMLMEKKSSG